MSYLHSYQDTDMHHFINIYQNMNDALTFYHHHYHHQEEEELCRLQTLIISIVKYLQISKTKHKSHLNQTSFHCLNTETASSGLMRKC